MRRAYRKRNKRATAVNTAYVTTLIINKIIQGVWYNSNGAAKGGSKKYYTVLYYGRHKQQHIINLMRDRPAPLSLLSLLSTIKNTLHTV